jgi:hypothetical protein
MERIDFLKETSIDSSVKFVRIGNEISIGKRVFHRQILSGMTSGMPDVEDLEIFVRNQEWGTLDMGILVRMFGKVLISGRSQEFNFPPNSKTDEEKLSLRRETLECLKKYYLEEDFEVIDVY